MVIDMIIDNIIYAQDDVNLRETKENWVDYLDFWKDRLNGTYISDAITSLESDNWKGFKNSMLDYMKDNGYEGCQAYNKLKRMSLKNISNCFK